jgi:hypothetical protein
MEQTEIFSRRIRCVATAAGVASALALFPILHLLYPALLIIGGIYQPRFPSTGRWLVWVGAAELWPVLITYDLYVLFPHPFQPLYMGLTFSASTVLLIWCSAELIVDGINRLRVHLSMPKAELQPAGWGAWIVAAVLNFMVVWMAYGLIGWHRQPNPIAPDIHVFLTPLVTAVIVITFDISLIGRVAKLRRIRRGTGSLRNS